MAASRLYLRFLRRFSTAAVDSPTTVSSGAVTVSKEKSKLRKVDNPDKDLAFNNSVSNNNASSPLSSLYPTDFAMEHTVGSLAEFQRFFDIEALIESHKNDPKIKTETFLSTLIRSYGIASMFEHAMKTFEEMDQLGTPISVVSFNALLAACLNSALPGRVPQLFDEIPQRYPNITPDEDSYKMLITSYCRSGSVEKAMKVFEEMDQFGVPRSVVSFNALLAACLHSGLGLSERVPQLFDEITQRYHNITPDRDSYELLVKSYCRSGSVEKARSGSVEKAMKVLEEMDDDLFAACNRSGLSERVPQLFDKFPPDTGSYNVYRIWTMVRKSPPTVRQNSS